MREGIVIILRLACLTILLFPCSTFAKLSIRAPYRQLTFDYQLWQQDLTATSLGNNTSFRMGFQGMHLGYRWARPQKNFRWVTTHAVAFAFGQAKGAAEQSSDDQVKNQPWVSASLDYGWLYRSSARSELAFTLPLTLRQHQWQLKPGLQFKDKTTASIGAAASFVTRFNAFQSIHLTLTHQYQWQTSVWSLGYRQDLR